MPESAPSSADAGAALAATTPCVILGIGSLLRTDDGVGVHVAHELLARNLSNGAEVLDGGVAPLDALSGLPHIGRLIIIDAAELGETPGTIRVLRPEDLVPAEGESISLHDLDLLWALNVMRVTGTEPDEIVIVGVQPQSMEWNTELSPAVAARLDDIIAAVLAVIPARTSEREKVRP